MRVRAFAVVGLLAGLGTGPARAEVERDGDRLTDGGDAEAAGCRAAHAGRSPAPCPRFTRVTPDRIELFGRIEFEYDKRELRPSAYPILDEVAAVMRARPELRIEVQAHHRDEPDRALRLSHERAKTVARYLIEQGIASDRLTSQGYGDEVPLVRPGTPAADRINRRIELHRVPSP